MTIPGMRRFLLHLLVVGLFAMAGTAVPRMHVHAASHVPAVTVDLSAYAMPDGTLPELCLGAGEADGGAPPHCFACRLVAMPGVLPAVAAFDRPLAEPMDMPAPRAGVAPREPVAWRPDAARAPPGFRSPT